MSTERVTGRFPLLTLAGVGVLGLTLAQQSRADTILMSQTTLISGSSALTSHFVAPTAGTVTVQLANIDWPIRLSSLSFAATSGSQVMSAWSWSDASANLQSFEVSAGDYFAHVTGQAAGVLNLGLYSLSISFKPEDVGPVPIPGSDWLFVGGMFVLAGAARMIATMRFPRLSPVLQTR